MNLLNAAALHLLMVLKKIREINARANEGIKKKIKNAKEDRRHLALVLLELFLVILILLSLLFLFDPAISFPDSEKIPWQLKLVLFVAAIALVFKLYSYTKEFRVK